MALGQEEIGRRIAEARDDADLTQQELADRIGVKTGQSISRYERGETEVSTKRLRRIAQATGKPLSFFVQNSEARQEVAEGEREIARRLAAVEELLQELLRRLPDAPDERAGGSAG